MKWIDEILAGLTEYVGSKNVYDILDSLGIIIYPVEQNSLLLRGNEAIYHKISDLEVVYISNKVNNKEFVLAHEIGHAVLHPEEKDLFYNPLLNKGKLEREANYFATKLLYSNLELEEGIETYEQLADRLGINEDNIKYIIK